MAWLAFVTYNRFNHFCILRNFVLLPAMRFEERARHLHPSPRYSFAYLVSMLPLTYSSLTKRDQGTSL